MSEIAAKGNLTFSGHESFYCRQFWLKKGYDFVNSGHAFSEPNAVVELGVGKNMVTSISYWMKNFDLLDEDQNLTWLAHFLFGTDGVDPFLEDPGSLWLLHYHLVSLARASIFTLVFNQLRRQRRDWTRDQLVSFLERSCRSVGYAVRESTLQKDADVFVRTYLRPERGTRNIEDDFSSLLIDLGLLTVVEYGRAIGGRRFSIDSAERDELPWEIVLYSILDQQDGNSFAFNRLINDDNSPGVVFALSEAGLATKVDEIASNIEGATFTNDAGIRELQVPARLEKQEVLKRYYAS